MTNRLISVLLIFFLSVSQFDADQGNEEDPDEKPRYQQYVNEQNYHIPFKTRISEPFREYQTVHAVGKVNADPKRVDLNFYKGGNEDDDMPLHLSVRFDEGLFKGNVVFNTLVNKNWSEPEERVQSPFKPDDEFDIRMRLDISAMPLGNRVNFNLYKTNNDIALHISIRYSEGIIVRNSMISNQWGDQEIEGSLPLAKNEIFDLTIINEQANFLILFNGKKFCNFVHRSQNFDIETLEVDGTFELHTVTINNAR
uniref:Galectin n=1 Tax=Meloidogyne floridensis TaxID=298350 RepID=A0A915P0L3_9BILA